MSYICGVVERGDGGSTEMSRVAPYIVADYINSVQKFTFPPKLKVCNNSLQLKFHRNLVNLWILDS